MAALLCMGCGGLDEFVRSLSCFPEDGPSPFFVIFTVVTHGITGPLVALASFIFVSDKACSDDMALFGPLQLLASAFHIAFSIHMYRVMAVPYADRWTTLRRGNNGTSNRAGYYDGHESDGPCERLFYVFMYDPWSLFAFAVSIFQIVWIVLGMRWVDQEANADCNAFMTGTVTAACVLAIIHLVLGFFIVILTTTCDSCQREERRLEDTFGGESSRMENGTRGRSRTATTSRNESSETSNNPFAAAVVDFFFRNERDAGRNNPDSRTGGGASTGASHRQTHHTEMRTSRDSTAARGIAVGVPVTAPPTHTMHTSAATTIEQQRRELQFYQSERDARRELGLDNDDVTDATTTSNTSASAARGGATATRAGERGGRQSTTSTSSRIRGENASASSSTATATAATTMTTTTTTTTTTKSQELGKKAGDAMKKGGKMLGKGLAATLKAAGDMLDKSVSSTSDHHPASGGTNDERTSGGGRGGSSSGNASDATSAFPKPPQL